MDTASVVLFGSFMKLNIGALTVPLIVAAAACGRKAPPPPAPVEVSVTPVIQRDVPVVSEWIGTLDGSVNADIRPKVEGYLRRQVYKEGQFVHAGNLLFEIDPRQFRAALQQAQGAVGQADAQLAKASKDVERFTPLAAQRAVSQQELDNALSAERNARAALASARAAADQSALSMGWTRITSPIDGVVGIAKSQVGDLVNTQTVMTTVSTVDPIRVTYGISEREYLRYAERINRANYATTLQGPVLELVLDDGTVYPQKGRAVLVDREIDAKTGTMTIRGFFPNPRHILRPGQYAKVRAALEVKPAALLVPQRAVMELQGGYRVAVAGPDDKADIRAIQTGERVEDLWVVEKGLKAGDRVIVTGLQYVRAGTPLKITSEPSPAPATSAAASR
jgi:membrane fusion protein (multidrug efflux system)